jgi:hypothetical protein
MAHTKVFAARVPRPLAEGAREALGLPEDVSDSEFVRRAFAALAGLDVHEHTPRPGRPSRKRTDRPVTT